MSDNHSNCEAKVWALKGGNPAPCSLAGTSTDPTGSALPWAIAVSMGCAAVGYRPRVRCLAQPRANSKSSAISSEKMPSASVMPTPTPAPPMPMQAIPAPIYFAAVGSMRKLLFEGCLKDQYSMTRVNRIVEVDASQDGENVGLQHSHQQLERREHRRQSQRQGGAKPA